MSNTIDSALLTDMLVDRTVTTLQNRLAMFSAFSTDFGTDRMKPLAEIQVPYATAVSAVQTDPTNFETGDTTLDNIAITINQYSKSFHITNAELNSGRRLENLIDINLGAFADKLIDVALAPVTVANFGAASVTGAAATFDLDDIRTLYGDLKKSPIKNAILDSPYYAQFAVQNDTQNRGVSVTGLNGMFENSRWTGAGTNVVGFFCNPQAIGIGAGLPLSGPAASSGEFIALDSVAVPGIGLSVQYAVWFSRASRTHWASFDVMLGAAAGDTAAGKIVVSA